MLMKAQQSDMARLTSVEILSTAAQVYEKIAFVKACSERLTLKATQGHRKWR